MALQAYLPICPQPCLSSKGEGQAAGKRSAQEKYLLSLHVQFLMRFLDFLSVNMVLPTLPDYLARLGGQAEDYYLCLEAYAFCFMIGTAILGAVVDGGRGRILPSYIGTAILIVMGNALFSLAGSVPFLQRPFTLVLARCLVGFGASNAVLAMIFVTEVCESCERQKWVIRFGITRSQGMFWGPALGMALSLLSSDKTGLWGADTVVGWFQALSVAAAVGALVMSWQSTPTETDAGSPVGCEELPSTGLTFRQFLLQGRVIAVLLVMATSVTAQMACEVVIPVVCTEELGWHGPKCGTPLSAMAVLLTMGQLLLVHLTKRGMEDCTILLLGAVLFPVLLLGTVLLWLAGGPLGEFKVLGPFMLISLIGPFAVLGSMSVFMRLSMSQVPSHRGKCQAFQNNLLAMTNMLAPAWLSLSYSGERLVREKVPISSLTWLGCLELLALAAVLFFYRELRPAKAFEGHPGPTEPLLSSA